MQSTPRNNISFELKGSFFTLTVLHLLNPDMHVFTTQLRQHAQKTPNLFKNMPLVIDLQRIIDPDCEVDFKALQHYLRQYGLIPVGVRHGNEKLNHAAQAEGLAVLSNQSGKAKPATTNKSHISQPYALFVDKPVRSGQQIYAKNTNLVVLAQVSAGAELFADGSIHVYGVLRGRALAGVSGDITACIFCHKLKAELISIAGHYMLNENLPHIDAPMVQAYLKDEQVHVVGLPTK
jgi:septum site-determining protein MinC